MADERKRRWLLHPLPRTYPTLHNALVQATLHERAGVELRQVVAIGGDNSVIEDYEALAIRLEGAE